MIWVRYDDENGILENRMLLSFLHCELVKSSNKKSCLRSQNRDFDKLGLPHHPKVYFRLGKLKNQILVRGPKRLELLKTKAHIVRN